MAKRRNVAIRYERYANAQTAAAIYNVNRTTGDSPVVTAFDFIRDEESARKLERLREAKCHCKRVIGQMPMTTTRTKFLDIRRKAIADVVASGFDNAEAIFDSVWPSLKPTEEESKVNE